MILVDSSVWIDFFRDIPAWHVAHLKELLRDDDVLVGDLVLAEILQGYRSERQAREVENLLSALAIVEIGGPATAIQAARNYRALRASGITVRSTIDTLIATHCINNGLILLHNDRDFLPFERRLGLKAIQQAVH